MSENYLVTEFPLMDDLPAQEIEFVPFGTRTLKIRMTNPENKKGKYVLRSNHVPADFGSKRFYTYEKDGTNFRISWGGGQERGVCLNGVDKKIAGKKIPIRVCEELEQPSYIYLNVTHINGPANKRYTLELGIYTAENDEDSVPIYSLVVTLTPPKQVAAGEITDPIRLDASASPQFSFIGTEVPTYIDRWWSSPIVNYPKDLKNIPDLKLTADNERLDINMKVGSKIKTIAHVQDNIAFQDTIDKARYFDAEIYHFTEHFYVLRLWFAWLEKHGATTIVDEIPDAERFDLLIDGKKGRVIYAATDYHWREVWVPVPPPRRRRHLIAHLGMFSNQFLKLIGDKLPLLGSRHESWLEWATDAVHEAEALETADGAATTPRIPSHQVRLAVEGKLKAGHLGANVEAHVPNFENAAKPESVDFISSDPTKG